MSVGDRMTDGPRADCGAWLESRLGDVPEELAAAMRSALEEVEPPPAATPGDVLADAALAELDAVLRGGERDRRTALRLLCADALLTYAFEAAADPAVGGDAARAESLAERIGPRGALGYRIAAIEGRGG